MANTNIQSDLTSGKCINCGELSSEILIDDGRCIDCIESDNFFEETLLELLGDE